ncbi:CRISPR-associated protein, Cas5e family [Alloactinosynnema sp. L-07]|uniref:type I-E CRISPR-associated protein Cas5/CasD n=1 Tax=Alloactinosynnema sp. L-07 TaxID=1653480 RepID=UPI00065EF805|nr:type I-E CRISPR-associated protein Cas5/CasD [Alloactinosynnema sp. L-07]CRK59254.1 CRISPR-associated protein, Cas5e family [Alloactinosynnema sp. L-07]
MSTLLLRLAAPLQSWGTSSRFTRRTTDLAPSKSGIIGLLAAAQGRRRVDPITDLLDLRVGVRIDQAGQLERDFHTARTRDGDTAMPLSERFYLADAVFTVAVEGPAELTAALHDALLRPAFPLFLGRRSCPPAGKLVLGLLDDGLDDVLDATSWQASPRVQQRHREPTVTLDIVRDCPPEADDAKQFVDGVHRKVVRDQPISFDPRHRQYSWRTVAYTTTTIPNPRHQPTPGTGADPHDPMAELGA